MSVAAAPPVAQVSVGMALRDAAMCLHSASDSPRLDAELLLGVVLDLGRTQLIARAEHALECQQIQMFTALITQRLNGEPIAYILGRKEFWSLDFRVTPAVLVPRPETELLVEWALECVVEIEAPTIADLGTGSGAIALALAHERVDARVVATDASAAALVVARNNAKSLGLARVDFREGDWFAPLHNERFDLIVANPPYVAEGDAHLPALRHEPSLALTSGTDGLDAIRHLLRHAAAFLKPGGWLLLEHGATQAAAVRGLMQTAVFTGIDTRRDLAGLERATGGRAGAT